MNQRTYVKLQDIFGDVGGLWEFLGVLGVVLVVPVNKLDLQLKILNEVFSFEVDEKQEEKEQMQSLKLIQSKQ